MAFGLPIKQERRQPHSQYVQSLKSQLKENYDIASQNAAKAADKNKVRADRKVRPSKLEAGDRVLVRSLRLRGKHKLSDRWEEEIYVVVKQARDLPVYTVKPERHDGPVRTLHRDLLLPCGFLPAVDPNPSADASPVTRSQTRQQCQIPTNSDDSADNDFQLETTLPRLVPCPVRFREEKAHQIPEASSPSVAQTCPSPPPLSPEEPTAIMDSSLESASEHSLEEEMLLPVSVDLPEPHEPVLPPEQDLPESDTPVPEKQNLPGHSTLPSVH